MRKNFSEPMHILLYNRQFEVRIVEKFKNFEGIFVPNPQGFLKKVGSEKESLTFVEK